ncbi:MAG: hypothetical protein KKB25_03625 [Nanoarchaeota archaeon]|nr:hypothetical protein [Nanoarchaeota archaeon]
MVSVSYSHRLVSDADFMKWLHNQSGRESVLSHLMHIKSSSQSYKKEHNVILSSEANNCSGVLKSDKEKYLGAAFKTIDDPHYLSIHSEQTTKNIIFAIELANDFPYKCYILTAPEKEEGYRNNKHYKGVTSVEPISGERAIKVICDFFSAFKTARDRARMELPVHFTCDKKS